MCSAIRNFSISGRRFDKNNLSNSIDFWTKYIKKFFGSNHIDSVYSSVHAKSQLYGGRRNTYEQSFSYSMVSYLNSKGIGFMLTLSNHYFSNEAYQKTIPILEQLNNPLNSIAITNDELAKNIKHDFPLLKRKASVIKQITTHDEIYKALEVYDFITIPPYMNTDADFLQNISCKPNIILFANSACLIKCKKPQCYENISYRLFNQITDWESKCTNKGNMLITQHYAIFNLNDQRYNGFINFKLVPIPISQKNKMSHPEII